MKKNLAKAYLNALDGAPQEPEEKEAPEAPEMPENTEEETEGSDLDKLKAEIEKCRDAYHAGDQAAIEQCLETMEQLVESMEKAEAGEGAEPEPMAK